VLVTRLLGGRLPALAAAPLIVGVVPVSDEAEPRLAADEFLFLAATLK